MTVIDHRKNKGLSAARNTGFTSARTDFVFMIDTDDQLEPTALEMSIFFMLSYPHASFVKGVSVGFGERNYVWRKGFEDPEFLKRNPLTVPTLIRRSVVLVVFAECVMLLCACCGMLLSFWVFDAAILLRECVIMSACDVALRLCVVTTYRSAWQAVGGFDETMTEGLEDYDFWLKSANHGLWGGMITDVLDWLDLVV